MLSNKWTYEQNLAIHTKWINSEKTESKNILVNAAAGSGKTAVLVERIINKVCSDVNSSDFCDVTNLLVVTFTNAAAKQMQQRIYDALSKKYIKAQSENDMDACIHLKEQMSLVYLADITTIDAFCLKVVKNYFHLLDIDPDFSIIDKAEADMMKDEAIEELFEEYYGDDDFIKLLSYYSDSRDDSALGEIIIKIYEFTRTIPKPKDWLLEKCKTLRECTEENSYFATIKEDVYLWAKGAGEIILSALNQMISYVTGIEENRSEEEIKGCLDKNPPFEENELYITFGTYYQAMYEEYLFYRGMDKNSWNELYKKVSDFTFVGLNKAPNPRDKEKYIKDKEVLENLKKLRDEAKEIYNEHIKPQFLMTLEENISLMRDDLAVQAELLARFTLLFEEKYNEKKDKRNVKEFHDIEHLCLKLLWNNDEVRNELREKYKEILMDEYQDSNELQEKIFKSISRGDNLFMVGDMKQSIYRFRSSEPALFKYKCDTFKKGEKEKNQKIVLSKNFRSRKEVLDSVNTVFDCVMSEDTGGIDYDEDQSLNCGDLTYEDKNENIKNRYKSECIIVLSKPDVEEEIIENLDSIQLEARVVAKKIKELKDSQFLVRDTRKIKTLDENNNPVQKEEVYYRPVENKDIAILMSSYKQYAKIYATELFNVGIECFAQTSEYFDRVEIRLMKALLKMINNPYNEVALVSVMRSCVGGFSDDDLCRIRTSYSGNFYEAICENAKEDVKSDLHSKCKRLVLNINKWREYSIYMTCDRLIWTLYEETSIFDFLAAVYGNEAIENLRLLYQRAKSYESSGYRGLFNFIRYIDKLEKKEEDLTGAVMVGENSNAVRIMTIHKSKGLEFPVVFLSGAGREFNMSDTKGRVLLDKNLGFGLDYINFENSYFADTVTKEAVKQRIKKESVSEEMRKLYVALTRAKEKLVVTAVCKRKTGEDIPKLSEKWDKSLDKDTGKMKKIYSKKATSFIDWIAPSVSKSSLTWAYEIVDYNEASTPVIFDDNKLLEESFEVSNNAIIYDDDYTYKNILGMAVKTTVSQLKQKGKNTSVPKLIKQPEFLNEEDAITGAKRGTVVHYVMQKYIPTQNFSIDEIDKFIEKLLENGELAPKEAKSVDSKMIYDFYSSDLGKRILKSDKVIREAPFEIEISTKEAFGVESDEKIILQGVIDCMFYEGDEVVIVDYKTDYYENDDEIKQKYQLQLEYYSKAVQKLCKTRVKNKYLYMFFTKSVLQC